MARRSVGAVDTIWLNMDRPNNLMVIDGVMWFDEPVDWDRLVAVVSRRLVARYPVFRQRAVPPRVPLGVSHWEDDPDFVLARHLRRATLPPPGDQAALQRYVEAQVSRPLPRDRPLWEIHLVDGYRGGSAVVSRLHHALADGVALMQVLLSLSDPTPSSDLEEDGDAHTAGATRTSPWASAAARGRDAADAASSVLAGTRHVLSAAAQVRGPGSVVDALTLARQTGRVADKLLLGSNPTTVLSGRPGVAKRVVWSAPRPLAGVKQVARLAGGTVNDVLVSAVAGAISAYLADHGEAPVDLVTMVPVNLRPPDQPLPSELGNRFALVLLRLPSGTRQPLARLAETKRRMDAIKGSPESVLTFGLIEAIGRSTPVAERLLVDFFAAKAIGVTTNVPGPTEPRYVAGSRIAGLLGWGPGSGDQTVCVAVLTYAGSVHVGFKVDAGAVPDAEKLAHGFDEELDGLLRIAEAW